MTRWTGSRPWNYPALFGGPAAARHVRTLAETPAAAVRYGPKPGVRRMLLRRTHHHLYVVEEPASTRSFEPPPRRRGAARTFGPARLSLRKPRGQSLRGGGTGEWSHRAAVDAARCGSVCRFLARAAGAEPVLPPAGFPLM